jgi:hypothetical protein
MAIRARFARLLPLMAIASITAALMMPWTAESFSGGLGDGSISFGGCTCHLDGQGGTEGGGTLEMWASNLDPQVGQSVQVIINVTMSELSPANKVGVFLLSDFTGGDLDRPIADGWRIEDDPNGGGNNYVEVVLPGPGTEVSLVWNLTAPITTGTYRLYARSQHGGGAQYYEENRTGLTFRVFSTVPLVPNLEALGAWATSDPRAGSETVLHGEFFANSSEDLTGVSVVFTIDGEVVGTLQNFTFPSQRSRTASITWQPEEKGSYQLEVRVDSTNVIGESNEDDNVASATVVVKAPLPEEVPGFEWLGVLIAILAAWTLIRLRRSST